VADRRAPRDLFEPMPVPGERLAELRLVEALLFASAEPLGEDAIAERLPAGADVSALLARLAQDYAGRGVELRRVAGKWAFRTALDLAPALRIETIEDKRLSRAQLETLAIVAYHQPVTRAEIEDIRGVSTSRGTLDILLDTGWVRMRGRRRSPGRPVTYGTTEAFLIHFSLDSIKDLPGLDELKGTGLMDARVPAGFAIPMPDDDPALRPEEDPLDPMELAFEPLEDEPPADEEDDRA
jgi:segregation and condensation protein B